MSDPLDVLLELIRQHAEEDTRRFGEVNQKLDRLVTNTESLMESRTLARGAWKATTLVATIVSGSVSLLGFLLTWLVKFK